MIIKTILRLHHNNSPFRSLERTKKINRKGSLIVNEDKINVVDVFSIVAISIWRSSWGNNQDCPLGNQPYKLCFLEKFL